MAKKKKSSAGSKQNKEFSSNPFSNLKGFAVSAEKEKPVSEKKVRPENKQPTYGSFADEMEMLGVKRLDHDEEFEYSPDPDDLLTAPENADEAELTEDEQFLQAMGTLQVDFRDSLPESASASPANASASRIRQLKQGKLKPEASLDLHGCKRGEVAERIIFFLQRAEHQGWETLLLITGRGLHSADGEPILRNEAEKFLQSEAKRWVAEWCRAPKHYGGNGALVLFLKKRQE
ncbi:DNA-nicking endonuclease, Smr domain [Malonomonas rubra DSM 5091]|uniref:DNA-nicking endonuclease, Smr domain n=1 Tax=Malonomonas rubra DSM 5091 TaxID=1122189 RepID=A0A1M6C5B9_MALRU|nr:Smr/MutS family protein [Malonomonas rubra]SHI56225.1 DNA-nicking endonuclease, Smr domain [Malonomonas rubra DSM 5091]